MYFYSRSEAGRELASKMLDYQNKRCVVIALSPGGVLVGAQICYKLHAVMMLLVSENINVPGEIVPIGAVSESNIMTANKAFSTGELEEFSMEYYNAIEQQRIEKLHKLHLMVDYANRVNRETLRGSNVFVVSDGLSTGLSLDVAADYLKPIKAQSLVAVSPVASTVAFDRMRLFADKVFCLSTPDNYIDTDHYYTDNTIPDKDGVFKIVQNISRSWMAPAAANSAG